MQQARPTFSDTISNNNTAQEGGGALNIVGGAAPSFNNCIVAHNRVEKPVVGETLYGGGGAFIAEPSTDPILMASGWCRL